jgi:molybdopterin converting factor small subunit
MEVTLFYNGILAEKAGKVKEPFSGAETLVELREKLAGKYKEFGQLNYVISLNGVIVHEDAGIKEGDRIVLIPPVPGG